MNTKLKVVSPAGESVREPQTSLAPRLNTLEGKTVGEIWNGGFRGDIVFPTIEEMLRNRYPGIKIIPFTEFPLVRIGSFGPETKAEILEAVRVALLEKNCDAVITGMGS